MFSRKKLVERRVILDQNDIPQLRRGEEANIITVLPNGDLFTSKYKANNDPTGPKFTDIANAHLRLDQAKPSYQFQQPYLPPQFQQWNGAGGLGQQNPYAAPFRPQNRPYFKIHAPTHQHILLAATRFNQAAVALGIEYAIVGGFAAHLYGGSRQTKSLDILLTPVAMANGSYIQPIIQDLFERNPGILETTGPDQFGQQDRIVVIADTAGVPINFFDCRNNNINFPVLVGMAGNNFDPTYAPIIPQNMPTAALPILLPRFLLYQRILHFGTYGGEEIQARDAQDILVFLNAMRRYQHVFTPQEAWELRPGVINLLHFAETHNFFAFLDLMQWRHVNIHLTENWRVEIRPQQRQPKPHFLRNGEPFIYRSNQRFL